MSFVRGIIMKNDFVQNDFIAYIVQSEMQSSYIFWIFLAAFVEQLS